MRKTACDQNFGKKGPLLYGNGGNLKGSFPLKDADHSYPETHNGRSALNLDGSDLIRQDENPRAFQPTG
jgi:hypothetical protein